MIFDRRKACQVFSALLELEEGRGSLDRLLRLHYLAERRSLEEVGVPIVARYFSRHRKYGPCAIEMLRLVDREKSQFGTSYIRGTVRQLKAPLPHDLITLVENRYLYEICKQYVRVPLSDLVREVDALPEWLEIPPDQCVHLPDVLAAISLQGRETHGQPPVQPAVVSFENRLERVSRTLNVSRDVVLDRALTLLERQEGEQEFEPNPQLTLLR